MLKVKEVFATVQGEGHQTGTPAVFVRFAGCNLWSGRESGREKARGGCGAWCDTDFVGGNRRTAEEVVAIVGECAQGWSKPLVVLTGGEPMLQLRTPEGKALVAMLRAAGYTVAIETNGTQAVDLEGVHIVVSPKPLTVAPHCVDHLVQRKGHTLKVVWPTAFDLDHLATWDFPNKFLQPRDDGDRPPTGDALQDCISQAARLGWRVSIQSHKLVDLP
jgi:organic radical activating enzyme